MGGKEKKIEERVLNAHKGELFLRFCFLRQETCGSAEIHGCSENIKARSALQEMFCLGEMRSPHPNAAAIKRLLARNKVRETHKET